MGSINTWWRSLSWPAKILVIALAIFLYNFIRKIVKGLMNAGKAAGDAVTDPITAAQYGVSAETVQKFRGYAVSLQEALWSWEKRWPFGWQQRWDEDETTVINILNKMITAGECRLISVEFIKAYPEGLPEENKLSLKQSLQKLFNDSERSEIRSFVYGNIT